MCCSDTARRSPHPLRRIRSETTQQRSPYTLCSFLVRSLSCMFDLGTEHMHLHSTPHTRPHALQRGSRTACTCRDRLFPCMYAFRMAHMNHRPNPRIQPGTLQQDSRHSLSSPLSRPSPCMCCSDMVRMFPHSPLRIHSGKSLHHSLRTPCNFLGHLMPCTSLLGIDCTNQHSILRNLPRTLLLSSCSPNTRQVRSRP